jgi:DNA-binding MarR family transcriptional regulator
MSKINISKSINIISREIKNKYRVNFKKFNINESEYQYLIYLYNSEIPVCQEDLVNHFNIDKAAVARAIKHLIKEGYVTKKRSIKDKRLYYLSLTTKANNIRYAFFEILDNDNIELLQEFNQDELIMLDLLLKRLLKKSSQKN